MYHTTVLVSYTVDNDNDGVMNISWDYLISSNIDCAIETQTWAKGSVVSYSVYFCPLLSSDERDVNFPVTADLSCRCYLPLSSGRFLLPVTFRWPALLPTTSKW